MGDWVLQGINVKDRRRGIFRMDIRLLLVNIFCPPLGSLFRIHTLVGLLEALAGDHRNPSSTPFENHLGLSQEAEGLQIPGPEEASLFRERRWKLMGLSISV